MHHVVVERWSRGTSPLHARDARAKIVVLLAFLATLATTPVVTPALAGGYAAYLLAGIVVSGLPAGALLWRAAIVLPFSAAFAAASVLAGDSGRAAALMVKSYLSAAAVLVVIGTTPLPKVLRGLEWLRAPRFLLLVVQFLYRYLFVVSEQAQHMRLAAQCRGGAGRPFGRDGFRFRAAAGAVSVLFARAYERAQGIHRSMLARGFDGQIRTAGTTAATWRDAVFGAVASAAVVAVRLALAGR